MDKFSTDFCFLLMGIGLGAFFFWLHFKFKMNATSALFREKASSQEQQTTQIREQCTEQKLQIQTLSAQFQKESNARAAAEEQNRRIPELQSELKNKEEQQALLYQELTTYKTKAQELQTTLIKERELTEEKLALLSSAEKKFREAFASLSSDALKNNNQSFLELAKSALEKFQETAKGDLEKRQTAIVELVKPVKESLDKFDIKIQDIEKSRVGAYESITQQVKNLLDTNKELRLEAGNLVKALGTPRIRGRWGEIQLKRVVEMAGMLNHCDFQEQVSVNTEDGRLRPDLIVRLPGQKYIVVDAKTPLSSYLEAMDTLDESIRKLKLSDHARLVRDHIRDLSEKSYWEHFQKLFKDSPEFVILFLPGENFFSAAFESDPSLIEQDMQRVILASPTTLIALLRAVAYGWRQEKIKEDAQKISDLGKELYKRISVLGEHFSKMGSALGKAVETYNQAVAALDTRVLVTARKFRDLESSNTEDLNEPAPIDITPRMLQSPEVTRW